MYGESSLALVKICLAIAWSCNASACNGVDGTVDADRALAGGAVDFSVGFSKITMVARSLLADVSSLSLAVLGVLGDRALNNTPLVNLGCDHVREQEDARGRWRIRRRSVYVVAELTKAKTVTGCAATLSGRFDASEDTDMKRRETVSVVMLLAQLIELVEEGYQTSMLVRHGSSCNERVVHVDHPAQRFDSL